MDKLVAFEQNGQLHFHTVLPRDRKQMLVSNTELECVVVSEAINDNQNGLIIELSPPSWEIRVKKPAAYRDETDEEFLLRIGRGVNGGAALTIVPQASLPSDLTFRAAWALQDGAVVVDMERARDIHRAKIRAARESRFRALDADLRASKAAEDTARVMALEQQLQELRDLPEADVIEDAETPEALKAAWPSVLFPNPYA